MPRKLKQSLKEESNRRSHTFQFQNLLQSSGNPDSMVLIDTKIDLEINGIELSEK